MAKTPAGAVEIRGPNRTIHDVRAWLANLQDAGRLWHMDDDLDDVVWTEKGQPDQEAWKPTKAELAKLKRDAQQAFRICSEAGVDIFELYPPMPGEVEVRLNEDAMAGLRWALSVALDEYEGTRGAIVPEWHLAKEASYRLGFEEDAA